MPITYDSLATTTLGSATATVTFSSISSTYTDLVIIFAGTNTADDTLVYQFNMDTGANYSDTYGYADGSAGSGRHTSQTRIFGGGVSNGGQCSQQIDVMDYANTATYKSILSRNTRNSTTTTTATVSFVGTWRSTAAISRIDIFNHAGSNFAAGSTFTLYGIKAA